MPCSRRNATICSMFCASAAQQRRDREAADADDEQLLAAEAVGQPADRRGHDRGGDDVGGQHPVDLVERGRQRALHVGQRHVGDRGVERLHDRRAHGADGQQRAPRDWRRQRWRPRQSRLAFLGERSAARRTATRSVRRRPVSMSTRDAHAGAQRDRSWPASNTMRTGTRCTTLTQLPLAFCGGRIANCAPVPGLTDATVPWKVCPGRSRHRSSTFWPSRR